MVLLHWLMHPFLCNNVKNTRVFHKDISMYYFKSQSPACFYRCISVSWSLHFFGDQWIVSRVTDDGHTCMIFGCCSQQSYTTCRMEKKITRLLCFGEVNKGQKHVRWCRENTLYYHFFRTLFSSTYQCRSVPRRRPQWHLGSRQSLQMDRGCTPPLFKKNV